MNAPLPQAEPLPTTADIPASPAEETRTAHSGLGKLHIAHVDGASTVIAASATAPLHLLLPRPRGPAVWAVPTTLGGGLVAGDRTGLDLECSQDATLAIITQASTKIYKSLGPTCLATVDATIADGALLALLPDPVTPFAGAKFHQEQRFSLEKDASLVLIDSVTCGRAARGERYAWSTYRSRLRIAINGRPWLHDHLRLDPPDLPQRMGRFAALATVIAVGPRAGAATAALLATAAEAAMTPAKSAESMLRISASPLPNGVILRAGSTDATTLATCIRTALGPVLAQALGEDPWARRP
jgi:urease accessory protein